jgi:hypothetical protein
VRELGLELTKGVLGLGLITVDFYYEFICEGVRFKVDEGGIRLRVDNGVFVL